MKLLSDVLLREYRQYKSMIRLTLFTIAFCWLSGAFFVIPIKSDLFAFIRVAVGGIAGFCILLISLVYSTVYYRFITRKNMHVKYRLVYLEMSRFGLILSALVVLSTVAVALISLDSNSLYPLLNFFALAQIQLCLVLMKFYMNKRQKECDQEAKSTTRNTDASSTKNANKMATYGDHTTNFNVETRIVALPAYLSLSLKLFEVDTDAVLGRGADAVVVKATINNAALASEV